MPVFFKPASEGPKYLKPRDPRQVSILRRMNVGLILLDVLIIAYLEKMRSFP